MQYYVVINGQQTGPVDESKLLSMGVTRETLVWHEGMPQWKPAGTVPELSHLFSGNGSMSNMGTAPGIGGNVPMPKTYLTESILVTIFCCLPFGIVSIVNAAAVSSAWASGNYALAQSKSQAAKKWALVSLIVGLVGGILYGILVGIAMVNDPNIMREIYGI